MIAQRRNAEDADDLALFLGLPPSFQPRDDEVDELGRVIPSANSPTARANRTAAREARRMRRRATNQKQPDEEEGYSTDGSLPPVDADDYRTAVGKVLTDGKELMADVKAAEFREPMLGLAKWFGEWRDKFGDIYTGAWGGLGMVGAWEFWVRLEVLGWNPLEVRVPACVVYCATLTRQCVCSARGPSIHSAGTSLCTRIRAQPTPTRTKTSPSWGPTAISSRR